ncbi:hypothetical protein WAI453_008658 [Rhynchosporium graminicola]
MGARILWHESIRGSHLPIEYCVQILFPYLLPLQSSSINTSQLFAKTKLPRISSTPYYPRALNKIQAVPRALQFTYQFQSTNK